MALPRHSRNPRRRHPRRTFTTVVPAAATGLLWASLLVQVVAAWSGQSLITITAAVCVAITPAIILTAAIRRSANRIHRSLRSDVLLVAGSINETTLELRGSIVNLASDSAVQAGQLAALQEQVGAKLDRAVGYWRGYADATDDLTGNGNVVPLYPRAKDGA